MRRAVDGFRDRLRATVEAHLPQLPRFRQRLSAPARVAPAAVVPAAGLDWDWHVPCYELTAAGRPHCTIWSRGSGQPLPRDRPLWRFAAVTGFAPGKVAAVLIVHHTVADGIGTIAQAVTMLEPVPALLAAGPRAGRTRQPGAGDRPSGWPNWRPTVPAGTGCRARLTGGAGSRR